MQALLHQKPWWARRKNSGEPRLRLFNGQWGSSVPKPGGGATEMAISVRLAQKAKAVEGVAQWPYRAIAEAMEVIPRTLIQNAGSSPIRVLTQLRAKHAEEAGKTGAQGGGAWGIDGDAGKVVDM